MRAVFSPRNPEDPEEMEPAQRAALDHAGPALVSVKVAKHELSFPPAIDFEKAKGFEIYLIKTMLNSKGDEILDRSHEFESVLLRQCCGEL
jgi:pyruvate dehydrogenase (quinone)